MVNGRILIPLTLELYVYYSVLCIIELHSYIRVHACFFVQDLEISNVGTLTSCLRVMQALQGGGSSFPLQTPAD